MKNLILFFLLAISILARGQTTIMLGESINSNPVVNAGQDLVLASGQVQAQATVDDATASILWSGPNGFTSTLLRPWISDLGTYTITVTNSFGCSSSDQMELRLANPTDTLFINPPPMCIGEDSIWLFHYTTLMEGSFSGPGVSGYYFSPVQAGTHQLVWNIDGKVRTAYVTVLAGPSVWAHQDTLFGCVGQNVTLAAVGQADYYWWTLNSDTISTSQYHSVVVEINPVSYGLTAGIYYELENKTCYTRDTTTVSFIKTGFTYTQETGQGQFDPIFGSEVTFTPDFQYAQSYSWNFGNIYVSGGGTSNEISPTYNYNPWFGYFTVTLTMNSVCGVTTSTQVVRVNKLVVTGIDNPLTSAEDVNIYPNPVEDLLKLDFGDKRVSRVEVWDIAGRFLVAQEFGRTEFVFSTQIDVSNYQPGYYMLRVFGKDGGIFSKKFIKK
jgi:hypothetical protein